MRFAMIPIADENRSVALRLTVRVSAREAQPRINGQ